jgi:hypothetical protein
MTSIWNLLIAVSYQPSAVSSKIFVSALGTEPGRKKLIAES